MTESADVPIEDSIPVGGVPLESILCTEELHRRPSRLPNHEKENRALVTLMCALADSPETILQTLAETILDITDSDSAGISLLTADGKTPDISGKRFYWPAIAGLWSPHVGGGTPRNFGPCGDVLDRNRTLLFKHIEWRYQYFQPIMPAAEECLLVPFYVDGKAVGTIWALIHSDRRKFDAEDERVMGSLGKFASSAYQALASIDELHELADSLEMQVRARTRELERSTEELRRSEAFLSEGQRLGLTGSFSWRVATDEITWSEQLYRIYELEIGLPVTLELIRTRVHPEDISLLEKMRMVHRAGGGANAFEWQYRLIMPDQSIKYMHAVAHATRDRDGQLEYIAAVQDVTERRRTDETLGKLRSELAHVARMSGLGTLTASIAHEVNQPLSGIITNASTCLRMLDADPPNIDGARETARRTIRDGHRASEVIARLRGLFSHKSGTLEPVDLNEATREVIALCQSELQGKHIIVRPALAEDLPEVTGDRVQLQQVILNLLFNASDAMRSVNNRPKEAVIMTERDADGVRLTVRDSGEGLSMQTIDKVFEPFYTTKQDGMGIGLAVSRSIIESHHGRIWATPNDGPGATFGFSIPGGH